MSFCGWSRGAEIKRRIDTEEQSYRGTEEQRCRGCRVWFFILNPMGACNLYELFFWCDYVKPTLWNLFEFIAFNFSKRWSFEVYNGIYNGAELPLKSKFPSGQTQTTLLLLCFDLQIRGVIFFNCQIKVQLVGYGHTFSANIDIFSVKRSERKPCNGDNLQKPKTFILGTYTHSYELIFHPHIEDVQTNTFPFIKKIKIN